MITVLPPPACGISVFGIEEEGHPATTETSHELGSNRRPVEADDRFCQGTVGKLTDDDLNVIGGKKDQLVGRVQERYGIAKDEAQKQVDEWNKALSDQNQEEVDNSFNRKAS